MRIVLQRAQKSYVQVAGEVVGEIDHGLVLLVGVTHHDTETDADYLAEKVAGLRIFEDETGKMNISVRDTGGSILSISQFTLYGDTRKGKRPNFMEAARPEQAEQLYHYFNDRLRVLGLVVQTGVFGAMMDVHIINDGPVTLVLDSVRSSS